MTTKAHCQKNARHGNPLVKRMELRSGLAIDRMRLRPMRIRRFEKEKTADLGNRSAPPANLFQRIVESKRAILLNPLSNDTTWKLWSTARAAI